MYRLLFSFAVLFVLSEACTKEEYAALFGQTYELSGTSTPYLSSGNVVAAVSYLSKCPNNDPEFSIEELNKEDMDAHVFVIKREFEECEGAFEVLVQDRLISLPFELPIDGFAGEQKPSFVAYPPDGAFELVMLREKNVLGNGAANSASDTANASAIYSAEGSDVPALASASVES